MLYNRSGGCLHRNHAHGRVAVLCHLLLEVAPGFEVKVSGFCSPVKMPI